MLSAEAHSNISILVRSSNLPLMDIWRVFVHAYDAGFPFAYLILRFLKFTEIHVNFLILAFTLIKIILTLTKNTALAKD